MNAAFRSARPLPPGVPGVGAGRLDGGIVTLHTCGAFGGALTGG